MRSFCIQPLNGIDWIMHIWQSYESRNWIRQFDINTIQPRGCYSWAIMLLWCLTQWVGEGGHIWHLCILLFCFIVSTCVVCYDIWLCSAWAYNTYRYNFFQFVLDHVTHYKFSYFSLLCSLYICVTTLNVT